MARITFIAYGTRGDVQPLLALGLRLAETGHQVRLLAGKNFQTWIESKGLEVAAARVDMQAVMSSQSGQEWAEQGTNPFQQTRLMKKLLDQHGFTMMEDAWNACRDAEVIVSSFTSDVYAASIAEKTGARHVSTPLQPVLYPTRCGESTAAAILPGRKSWLNDLAGKWLFEPFAWTLLGTLNNRFRREILQLPAQTYPQNRAALHRMLVLQGYSKLVAPPADDWPENVHTTGYWFLDEAWQPPDDLLQFLDAGSPPVYIGFGSMTGSQPPALMSLILQAVQQAGVRAILQKGWGQAAPDEIQMPATIYWLDSAPHHWLFPQVSAVVHHGGAGTTAASLRAGKPTVIVPHMADQPFWGRRVDALGVGPKPIPRPSLTAANLAQAIRQAVEDAGMAQRAAALGKGIRAEDGVGEAVKFFSER